MRVVPYDLDTKASFEIAESTLGKFDYATNPASFFRDPAALKALEILAATLRDQGYKIDIPRPGKACQALCFYILGDRRINIMLWVDERREGSLKCSLSTFYGQPFVYRLLRRDLLASVEFLQIWKNLCLAIDLGLRNTLSASSVKWDRLRPR
jgi:hypothetical protein